MNANLKLTLEVLGLIGIALLNIWALENSEGSINQAAVSISFLLPNLIVFYVGIRSRSFLALMGRLGIYGISLIVAGLMFSGGNMEDIMTIIILILIFVAILSSIVYLITWAVRGKKPELNEQGVKIVKERHVDSKKEKEEKANAEAKKIKDAGRYLKVLGYGACVYFGIRLLAMIAVLIAQPSAFSEVFAFAPLMVALNLGIMALGVVSGVYIARFRKWALWTMTAVFSIGLIGEISKIIWYAQPATRLVTPLALLALAIGGFKQLKTYSEAHRMGRTE